MIINYIIKTGEGHIVDLGSFDPIDDAGLQAFRILQTNAWIVGHEVTTVRDTAKDEIKPDPKPAIVHDHDHERQGDEYYCSRCNRRWGFEDAPPPCN